MVKTKKRTNYGTAAATTTGKGDKTALRPSSAPTSSKKLKFDKDAVDAPGFCTDPSMALSTQDMSKLLSFVVADDDGGTANGDGAICCHSEKSLIGKGTRCLYEFAESDDVGGKFFFVYYYDGKKLVKKDRIRIEAMVDAAKMMKNKNTKKKNNINNNENNENDQPGGKSGEGMHQPTAYVILPPNAGICKRNTLPELVSAGYVVQRVD